VRGNSTKKRGLKARSQIRGQGIKRKSKPKRDAESRHRTGQYEKKRIGYLGKKNYKTWKERE